MKISSLGKLTLGCALALAASSAMANVTPNLQDASGAAVKDGSGACVVTSGAVLPGEDSRRRVGQSEHRLDRSLRRRPVPTAHGHQRGVDGQTGGL